MHTTLEFVLAQIFWPNTQYYKSKHNTGIYVNVYLWPQQCIWNSWTICFCIIMFRQNKYELCMLSYRFDEPWSFTKPTAQHHQLPVLKFSCYKAHEDAIKNVCCECLKVFLQSNVSNTFNSSVCLRIKHIDSKLDPVVINIYKSVGDPIASSCLTLSIPHIACQKIVPSVLYTLSNLEDHRRIHFALLKLKWLLHINMFHMSLSVNEGESLEVAIFNFAPWLYNAQCQICMYLQFCRLHVFPEGTSQGISFCKMHIRYKRIFFRSGNNIKVFSNCTYKSCTLVLFDIIHRVEASCHLSIFNAGILFCSTILKESWCDYYLETCHAGQTV